jgi:hypothetical protein
MKSSFVAWSAELDFSISGGTADVGGEGLAFWYSTQVRFCRSFVLLFFSSLFLFFVRSISGGTTDVGGEGPPFWYTTQMRFFVFHSCFLVFRLCACLLHP